jgi:plastocyanin
MKKFVLFPVLAILSLTAALVAIHAASHESSMASQSVQEVKIDNFSFAPASITVAAGTTVRWTNRDDIPHNIVSSEHSFKSKVLDTDEQFSYTFDKPGTYAYSCGLHPRMQATITVK